MRKALGILLSIMLILGFISCQQPTNSSDDFANQNPTEQPKDETTDKGENEKEEIPPVVEAEEETEEEIVLNLGLTKTYSMLIGETVNLASMIDECDVWYEVQSGDDVISVDGNTISAISVGTATLKATDWEDESRTWKCVITVSAEGFTGTALAKGYVRFSDILSQSKVSSSPTLVDILEKLIKMDVVTKEFPINDENNRKKVGYYVSDQLTLFYFKYIYRNLSRLAVMDSDVFYEKFIKNDFEEHYVSKTFEQVCKQFLIRKNRLGELEDSFEKIGKYYYDDPVNRKNGEFDIVTESDNSYIFYEAKFKDEKLDKNLIYTEIKQVNDTGLVCKKYGFFSKSGYKEIDNKFKSQLILYSIEDLFSED